LGSTVVLRQDVGMSAGKQIGRYRLEKLLGTGAFASVWLATDPSLPGKVAIKILADNWTHKIDVRDRFIEEARLLRKVKSERIVAVHDFGTTPSGQPFFVMAYADKGTVADELEQGPLALRRALYLTIETARAAADLHEFNVIHRDIQPSNVLIQSTVHGTRVLLADLGLAKADAHASGFTIVAGTPGYTAPEQDLRCSDLDARADVYSLGALAYRLITNRLDDPASRKSSDLPSHLAPIVLRALKKDRERRWPDAKSFADALEDAAANARPHRKWPVKAAALLTITALTAIGLWWGFRSHNDGPVNTPSSAPANSATASSSASPGELDITFVVEPIPDQEISASGVNGLDQWMELRDKGRGYSHTVVTVHATGAFAPLTIPGGEAIKVGERTGFYYQRFPAFSTSFGGAEPALKPAVALEYAPNAWYVVMSDLPAQSARPTVLRIAEAVRFGRSRPLRFPVRLGYVPAPLRPCGGLDGLEMDDSSWNAWINLCDEIPGTDSRLGNGPAVEIFLSRDRHGAPEPSSTQVNGLPTRIDGGGGAVDGGEFLLSVSVADNHRARYNSTEIRKIIEGLELRSFDHKEKWWSGSDAVSTPK
jgi:serine/threonine protein kinase